MYEAKLLIVGEGGAGKTSLARKIQNPEWALRNEKSTQGIEVIRWEFQMASGQPFRVNVWDFGGQEIYHATHQFFLTKRSLYALVADTRREDTDFYYWLNIVQLLSDNSPLLIIKNEKQDRQTEINEPQLRGQFTNLKTTLSTNLQTNRGLTGVIDETKHYLTRLSHVGSALPKTWVKVRAALEEDQRDYISLDEYLTLCDRQGIKNDPDKFQLSGYLHDLGVVLHFQDDPLLKYTLILKPTWVTAAVYRLLDDPAVRAQHGHFTRAQASAVWREARYARMHDELLQLLQRFRLCYPLPDQPGTYIATQLLSDNRPAYSWDEGGNLIVRYTYDFMPKGILTQLIVRMRWYAGRGTEKKCSRSSVHQP